MRKSPALPPSLDGCGFTYAEARAAGVDRSHLYSKAVQRPFHGARTAGVNLADHVALCRAAAAVLPTTTYFSHASAAVLHAFPLPRHAEPSDVEVSVFEPARPPEIAGIAAHQLTSTGQRWVLIKGLRVIGAEDVWAQLSHRLSIDDLVVVGDFLVTGDQPYSGIPPSSTIDRMAAAVRRHGRRRGVRDLRCALERIRYGSMSPQETRLRLALIDAGLPEPELNVRVVDPEGRLLALIDLAYPEHRVAIEYLGDHHRREKSTYRNDIARREMLSDLGWSVIFVTGGDHLTTAAHRVRRALLRSSPGEIAPNPV